MARSNKSSAYMVQRKLAIQEFGSDRNRGFVHLLREATKFSQYLLDSDKRYETTISLGTQTATGDREGEIVAKTPVPLLTEEVVERCLGRFRGEIHQTPSMYSAIKKDGQPLYKLARQGIEVERGSKACHHLRITLRGMGPETLDLEVTVLKALTSDL